MSGTTLHNRWVSASLLLTAVLFIAGCTPVVAPSSPPAAGVPAAAFVSLARGETAIAEIEGPALLLASSAEEAARFAGWLTEGEGAAKVAEVDFGTSAVAAVFAGMRPTSGFGVTVEDVTSDETGVTITVTLNEPPAGQAVADVISFPYHVIAVPLAAIGDSADATWRVVTVDGEELVSNTAP